MVSSRTSGTRDWRQRQRLAGTDGERKINLLSAICYFIRASGENEPYQRL
jgi:hypothetical protein